MVLVRKDGSQLNTNRSQSTAGHALVVILSLAAGYLLDLGTQSFQNKAAQTFRFGPSLVTRFLIPILLAALFLGLAWYLVRCVPSPQPAAFFFLAAGLIGIVATVSVFLPKPLFLKQLVFLFEFWNMVARNGSSFYLISSFLLVLGISGVFLREKSR